MSVDTVAPRPSATGVGFVATPELKKAVLTRLLQVKAEHGEVRACDVRDAARVVGCSTRTVRRWIAAGAVPTGDRGAWTPPSEYREMLLRHGGSVAALRGHLVAQGTETVSARTMQRAIARTWPTALVTFTRGGFQAASAELPTTSTPDLAVNAEWSMDDTMIPLWCLLPSGEIGKPWMEGIIDAGTRYIVSLTCKPEPFITEDAVENLANAVAGHRTENGVFVGGKPRALRTDRGSIFVSEATALGLVAASIDRRYSEAYTPQQNGKIERWHQIKNRLRHLPGYDWTDYKQGDPRKASLPPSPEGLLTYEEVVVEVMREVKHYNTERIHSAHKMTPEARWEHEVALDPDAVEPANVVALRAAARQTETRKLNRRRVRWEGRFYDLHPQSVGERDSDPEAIASRRRLIDAAEGDEVTLRYLRGRVEYVSVYNLRGQYLGDAVWEAIQTTEQAGETAATRRRHIKTMTLDLEAIAKADAEAVASRRQQILDDLEAQGQDFSAFDTGEDEPTGTGSGGSHGSGPSGSTGAEAAAPASRTRTQRVQDQRRQDALDAAAWARPSA